MASERTPLLANDADPSSRVTAHGWDLSSESASLLHHLRTSPSPDIPFGVQVPPEARLAVLLYALNELSTPSVSGGGAIRKIRSARRDASQQEALLEAVERLLDADQQMLEGEGDEESGSHDAEIDAFRQVFWMSWPAGGGKYITAMELLLPPHTKSSSPFLSHTLVRYQLDYAWRYGVSDEGEGWSGKLRRYITPRRAHILHLASLLVWVGLTLAIAIAPGAWISPYNVSEDSGHVKAKPRASEILWIIWTTNIIRNLSPIPSILALPLVLGLPTLPYPSTTYSLVVFSIPLLTITLIIPTYPSIPLHAPSSSMIPLSTLLLSTLNRSLRPLGILMPILVLALIVFSWAINGDPFRAFIVMLSSTAALASSTKAILEEPVEEGVAPFQARLSLFITFCMLLLIALTLGFARSALPLPATRSRGEEGRRWKGDIMPEDDWEQDYGIVIGRRARKRYGQAVLAGLGMDRRWFHPAPPPALSHEDLENGAEEDGVAGATVVVGRIDVLCPLDLFILPLDIVIIALRRVRRITQKQEISEAELSLWRIRQTAAVVLMGPPCFLLAHLGI